jgi:hypothetical protein
MENNKIALSDAHKGEHTKMENNEIALGDAHKGDMDAMSFIC